MATALAVTSASAAFLPFAVTEMISGGRASDLNILAKLIERHGWTDIRQCAREHLITTGNNLLGCRKRIGSTGGDRRLHAHRSRQRDQRGTREHRRLEHGVSSAAEDAQGHHDTHKDLMPPHDLRGPPQVQRLLAHLASAWISGALSGKAADVVHDTACRETADLPDLPTSTNSSRVIRGIPGTHRPQPRSVTAGTRRPRPWEYQPRMGSVSPRCRLHRSPGGSSSRAAPGVDALSQSRTAQDSPSSAWTSGPRWKARRMSWLPPSTSSMMSMLRDARSSSIERRCRAGGSSEAYPSCSAVHLAMSPSSSTSISRVCAWRDPHERTALAGLAPATEFGGVVRDRRTKI